MSGSISKRVLIAELARMGRIGKRQAEAVLEGLVAMALREARRGFTIPGLCKLTVTRYKARRCRNPRTGAMMEIPERDILRIRPLKKARDGVARGIAPTAAALSAEEAEAEARLAEPIYITFRCTSCGQEIEASTDMAESDAACPGCGAVIRVPSTSSISELVQIEDLKETALIEQEEPAAQKPEPDERWKKGATIRIEVPKSFRGPRAVKRTIYIKRRK
ncbi:MAG: HU family DNA-binding protein [Kiritimatiellae bacterium]|nr:HU family DNA-binding protein [Kiritimatiellia bacterium]